MKKTVICEYVGYGHPDKVADQISDALLDAFLEKDPNTRAGIEVMIKDNIVVLGGEVKSTAQIDYDHIVRETMDNVCYPDDHHLSGDDIKVINLIGKQSPEISRSVDQDDGIIGAGDQGFCVGFASNETEDLMPLGAYLARKLCQCAEDMSHTFGPDIKSQVVVSYDEEGKGHVDSILVSTMHQCSLEKCREILSDYITNNGMGIDMHLFLQHFIDDKPDITINPAGEWHIGGSISDCGMTNRKIVVDQYGGYAPVGGGGLSGKDMSKVDRSGTYMCRYLAKNIVEAGLADTAKVELAYIIGQPQPCAINIELNYFGKSADMLSNTTPNLAEDLTVWIREHIDLSPKGIIERFDGLRPRFYEVTRQGHFGHPDNEVEKNFRMFPWEETDIADILVRKIGIR
jgi:S-adenosylmethionine synthetase